jgi:hypothetical protein
MEEEGIESTKILESGGDDSRVITYFLACSCERKDSQRIAFEGGVDRIAIQLKIARDKSLTIVSSCVGIIQWVPILTIVFARAASLLLRMCLLDLAHGRLLGGTIIHCDIRLQDVAIVELRAEIGLNDECVRSGKGGRLVMRAVQMTALDRVRLLFVLSRR